VFLGTGLLLGMWMTAVSLIAYWMWAAGALRRLRGISFGGPLLVLLVVTLLCRSTGALTLLAFGLLILRTIRRTGWALPIWLLVAITPFYEVTRASNLWSGRELVDISRSAINDERALSLDYRMFMEDMLAAKAMQRPVFGWGGWGRSRVYDAEGRDISITDGYWIIALGNTGIVGLASLNASLLLPLVLLTFRYRVRSWTTPAVAPAAAFAVLLGLYMIDNLSNAMLNPIYTLAIGGLSALRPGRVDGEDRQEDEGGGALADHARGLSSVPLDAEELLAVRQRELAERLAAAGYAEEAEQAWRRALGLWRARASIRPDDRGRRRDLALGCERFGRFLKDHGKLREAAETWQAALDLMAESTTHPADQLESAAAGLDLCNDLAWLLANGPDLASRDPARAVALATKAVETEPGCAIYWNTLGVAHYRVGECQAAITALGRAVELGSGGTGFDHLFLAMAHARRGDHSDALIWFHRGASWIENYRPEHAELRHLRDETEDLFRH
ncbi:MAG TPA: tetratricopeptide repeat protein, partial [Isosphaeraceae bacterium]|nr:tetratricopeptide repeat protein [Isosphaeraceae bacterium]